MLERLARKHAPPRDGSEFQAGRPRAQFVPNRGVSRGCFWAPPEKQPERERSYLWPPAPFPSWIRGFDSRRSLRHKAAGQPMFAGLRLCSEGSERASCPQRALTHRRQPRSLVSGGGRPPVRGSRPAPAAVAWSAGSREDPVLVGKERLRGRDAGARDRRRLGSGAHVDGDDAAGLAEDPNVGVAARSRLVALVQQRGSRAELGSDDSDPRLDRGGRWVPQQRVLTEPPGPKSWMNSSIPSAPDASSVHTATSNWSGVIRLESKGRVVSTNAQMGRSPHAALIASMAFAYPGAPGRLSQGSVNP